MNANSSKYFLLLLMVFVPFMLKATIPDTVNLRQVEVKASAWHTAAVLRLNRIDSASMQSFKTYSLSDLVQQNSTVFIKSNGPGALSTASFRGTTANHTLVLWNGFPINGPQLGQVDFSVIPVFLMDQVSLAVGNAGNNRPSGVGGVIMVDNVPQFSSGFSVEATQSIGSFGSFGTFLGFSFSKGKLASRSRVFRKSSRNNFSYLNTASWPQEKTVQEDADYHDHGFLQEFHFQFGEKSLLSFASWNQWNNHNLPPIMTNLDRGGDPKEQQNDVFSRNVLTYKNYWKDGSFEASSSFFVENQHYFLKTTSSFEPYPVVSLIDSRNQSNALMSALKMKQRIGSVQFNTSLQHDREWVKTLNYRSDRQRQRLGMSAGALFDITEDVHVNLNVRYDFIFNAKGGLNPFAEIVYQPQWKRKMAMSFSAGRVLRLPTMNDLYWFPGGNDLLVPEHALSGNLAVSWNYSKSTFHSMMKVAGFASDIQHWIQWHPTAYRYWIPKNIARVFARGLEVQIQQELKMRNWNFKLQTFYTYTKTTDESPVARVDNYSGRQLIYIPKHHGNMNFFVSYGQWYLRSTVDLVGQRRTSLNDDMQWYDFLPAYQLLHLGIGVQNDRFDFFVKVNNLLDQSYQAVMWRPMPGRNLECVLSYKFNTRK